MTEKDIMDILSTITDPKTQKKLSEISKIDGISEGESFLRLRLVIDDIQPDERKAIRTLVEDEFSKRGVDVLVSVTSNTPIPPKPKAKENVKPFLSDEILSRFKKIVAVYSTKGGVGKSTVSANIALEFAQKGLKVAIVDLDIYGPSIPRLLGLQGKVTVFDQKFVPAELENIHMMSVGLLLPEVDSPLIWRAPVVNGVISQIFTDTLWDSEYDVLILDMPPGTGDISILVGQSIPLDGMLVVSTPQGVALEDTFKGMAMFKKFDVPVLGVVFNMVSVICEDCNKLIPIFKYNQDFDQLIMDYKIDVIAELPLDPNVTELADNGELDTLDEGGFWKKEFAKITDTVVEKLNLTK